MPNTTLVDGDQVAISGSNPLPVTGGGGGAATIADGADVVAGAVADAAITTNATGTISGKLRGIVALLSGILTAKIDQTTPGTTNAVQANAGTNLNTSTLATSAQIGEVQASPTANTVLDRLKSLLTGIVLSAGTALIGKVGFDQTTPGTTNAVAPISGQAGVAGGSGANGATVQRVTIATDDAVMGGTADAAATAGSTGSISAKLRAISRDIVANIVLAASSAIIGKVGVDQTTPGTTDRVTVGGTVLLTSTPTLSVAGAYATGDYIGPSTTPASFTNVSRTSGYANVIKSLAMIDKVVTAAVALELWLFSATFTAPTDNAAWTVSDADMDNFLGVIPIATTKWYAGTVNKGFSDDTLGLIVAPAVTTIFYALVARGSTPTWASGDLVLKLGVLQQ